MAAQPRCRRGGRKKEQRGKAVCDERRTKRGAGGRWKKEKRRGVQPPDGEKCVARSNSEGIRSQARKLRDVRVSDRPSR